MKVKFTIYVDSYIVKVAKIQLVRGEASHICEEALKAAIKAVNVDQEMADLTKKMAALAEIKQLPSKECSMGEALAELAAAFVKANRQQLGTSENLYWISNRSLAYRSLRGVPSTVILERILDLGEGEKHDQQIEKRSKKKN